MQSRALPWLRTRRGHAKLSVLPRRDSLPWGSGAGAPSGWASSCWQAQMQTRTCGARRAAGKVNNVVIFFSLSPPLQKTNPKQYPRRWWAAAFNISSLLRKQHIHRVVQLLENRVDQIASVREQWTLWSLTLIDNRRPTARACTRARTESRRQGDGRGLESAAVCVPKRAGAHVSPTARVACVQEWVPPVLI